MSATANATWACIVLFGIAIPWAAIALWHSRRPEQVKATWRWITQPIRFVGLVLLIVGSAWLIRDTLTSRYEYRTSSGTMIKVDTWTGDEWIRGAYGWVALKPAPRQ